MKKRLTVLVEEIVNYPAKLKQKDVLDLLATAIQETIEYISIHSERKPVKPSFKINLDSNLDKNFDSAFGMKIKDEKLVLAKWIFELQHSAKNHLLYFLIAKNSLLSFIGKEISQMEHAILNIITIQWLKEQFNIKTMDSSLKSSITSRIYSDEIAGISHIRLNTLLNIVFIKNIPYQDSFLELVEITDKEGLKETEIYTIFSKWVNNLIKDIDIISPIYFNSRIIPTLDLLVEYGFEKGNTTTISRKLGYHINTVGNHFREMSTRNSAFWRPLISLERIKLNNYFFKVYVENDEAYDQAYNLLWKSPYLKTIYSGESDDYRMIYSPNLICPHVVSEQLNEQLSKLMKNGSIIDYSLQLIRGRHHYTTVTTDSIKPSQNVLKDLMEESKTAIPVKKYIFAKEERDFSLEFDDKDLNLDYNLLFFLSILKSKYLLKSRYGVFVEELPKLYEKNNIDLSDINAQTDFLNQIEIRARKRNILSYALFMRSFAPQGRDILITEIPTINLRNEDLLQKTIDRLRNFSFIGQITLSDRMLFILPGISHKHSIRKMMEKIITKDGLESNFYTIQFSKFKFIPFHDLYNFEEKKWLS